MSAEPPASVEPPPPSPSLEAKQLRPYVSVLLYDLRDAGPPEELAKIIAGGLEPVIQKVHSEGKRLRSLGEIPLARQGSWSIAGHWHEVETPPSWLGSVKRGDPPAVLYDRTHYLTLFAVRRSPPPRHPFGALLSTDPQVKKELVEILRALEVPTVAKDELAVTFLRGPSRQTWLRGVHRPVAIKPDTKILAGPDLRDAIDPVEDQSFTLDAALSDIRSTRIVNDFRLGLPESSRLRLLPAADAVGQPPKKKRSDIVGVSLKQGTMWTRTTEGLRDFVEELDDLCNQIQATREKPTQPASGYAQRGYRTLARPDIDVNPDRLGHAVDFAFDLPLPSEEMPGNLSDARLEALQQWREHGEFAVAKKQDDSERLFVDAIYQDQVTGTLRVQPILQPDGRGSLKVTVSYPKGVRPEDRDRLDYVLMDVQDRASLWFSNGYAMRDGEVFNLQYRDVPFTAWKWMPFRNGSIKYDLAREKPAESKLWEVKWNRQSLFEFIVNNVQSVFAPEGKDWHLLSDDGSGEIADFVFLDPKRPRLVLVHVKASGKGEKRGIAPAKYEIVVSQATKNLRFLDPVYLADQLEKPLGQGRIRELTWTSKGQLKNRDKAITALRKMGAYFDRTVVVLQPHTTRGAWAAAEAKLRANDGSLSDADRIQLLRLRMMLAALEDACRRFNATFESWGDDDPESSEAAFPRAALL